MDKNEKEERPRRFIWLVRKGLGKDVIKIPRSVQPHYKIAALAKVTLEILLYHDDLLENEVSVDYEAG